MNKLDLNLKEVHSELVEFLRESFKKAGFSKAVLGLSGGSREIGRASCRERV